MSVDVKIKTEDGNFKYRVSGIIIRNNKILVLKMNDNDFYCLPGGHVELGEDTKTAVLREMKEETQYDLTNPKLIGIVENFFENKDMKKVHELGFYYIFNTNEEINIEKEIYTRIEHDKDKDVNIEFRWVDIDLLNEIVFRPQFIADKLMSKNLEFEHYIIRD